MIKENDFVQNSLEERNSLKIFNKKLKFAISSINDATIYMKDNSKYYHLFVIITANKLKNNKQIDTFISFIKEAEKINPEEINEQRSQSKIFEQKLHELLQIKQFVNENYNNLLPQDLHFILNKQKENKKEEDIIVEPLKTMLGKKTNRDINEASLREEINLKKKLISSCYICKTMFTKDNIHMSHIYLCSKCGDLNESFKKISLDLNGRIAVVTGGRVKIGYEIVKKLLKYNCKVIITSRFPKDTLLKYQKEADYSKWKQNLIIYPIDFRFFHSANKFIDYLYENYDHIDIIIHNAAQTIRRTSAYYNYLLPIESTTLDKEEEEKIVKCDYMNSSLQIKENEDKEKKGECTSLIQSLNNNNHLPFSVFASQLKIMNEKNQPSKTIIGNDGQPYDFSSGKNSWTMEIDDVPFEEFMEVQLINVWTPYYLNIKLKELLKKSSYPDKYIVNVSSVEGMFNRNKTTQHPHTNMAKAALNMMTRTVGKYYKKSGIYMTSVDTGWVSEMHEVNQLFETNNSIFQNSFINIPLNEEDGAIRVLHPIIDGILGKHYHFGVLLKDFKVTQW